MVKVSFVCPVFNKSKYLEDVLCALKKQTGSFEKEFIFVNDGSSDNSLELLKTLTKNWKNKKILSQTNKGPASATQRGIDISTGDYIKLLGGDDVMSPNCTDKLLDVLIQSNAVAVFSRYKLVENIKNFDFVNMPSQNLRVLKDPLQKTILSSYSGTSPNLYCKKTIEKSGGCNQKIFIEDFSLVLGLSKFGQFSFIDNITSIGPANDPNRIMLGKQTQLIHDFNAALYYFFIENDSLPEKLKRLACFKAIGRADKWARRTKNQSFFNKMNLLKLKLYLGDKNYIRFLKMSCLFFYNDFNDEKIRYKIS